MDDGGKKGWRNRKKEEIYFLSLEERKGRKRVYLCVKGLSFQDLILLIITKEVKSNGLFKKAEWRLNPCL